ncbi:MAG: WG repeat-containing protein [Ruminococcus sp.]|nr:WG repeat-containing protein [Ruminococcus sp.]
MNKHSRIIMIFLFIVIIALVTAIVVFHINAGKEAAVISKNDSDINASDVQYAASMFRDQNGLWGLKDSGGTIILDPEWNELIQINSDYFKAKLITRSGALYGVIDRNGDIIVPFVYSKIERLSEFVYSAKIRDSEEYLFYGRDFRLLLPYSANSYTADDSNLYITKDNDKFTYKQGEGLDLIKCEFTRLKRPINLTIILDDPQLISIMSSSQWSNTVNRIIIFLDALRRNKTDALSEIIFLDSFSDITALVKTKHQWRGRLSNDIYLYTCESDESEINILCMKTELIVSGEEETEFENIPIVLCFSKDETGEWLISDAIMG